MARMPARQLLLTWHRARAQPTAVPFAVYNAWKPFAAADVAVLERRTAEVAALSAERAAERMVECTFRPQLAAAHGSRPPSRAAAVGSPSPAKGGAASARKQGRAEAEE